MGLGKREMQNAAWSLHMSDTLRGARIASPPLSSAPLKYQAFSDHGLCEYNSPTGSFSSK